MFPLKRPHFHVDHADDPGIPFETQLALGTRLLRALQQYATLVDENGSRAGPSSVVFNEEESSLVLRSQAGDQVFPSLRVSPDDVAGHEVRTGVDIISADSCV